MTKKKKQEIELSYESDGKMNEEHQQKKKAPQQDEEAGLFFNSTQNSE